MVVKINVKNFFVISNNEKFKIVLDLKILYVRNGIFNFKIKFIESDVVMFKYCFIKMEVFLRGWVRRSLVNFFEL